MIELSFGKNSKNNLFIPFGNFEGGCGCGCCYYNLFVVLFTNDNFEAGVVCFLEILYGSSSLYLSACERLSGTHKYKSSVRVVRGSWPPCFFIVAKPSSLHPCKWVLGFGGPNMFASSFSFK
jgi:hypothetical protein